MSTSILVRPNFFFACTLFISAPEHNYVGTYHICVYTIYVCVYISLKILYCSQVYAINKMDTHSFSWNFTALVINFIIKLVK